MAGELTSKLFSAADVVLESWVSEDDPGIGEVVAGVLRAAGQEFHVAAVRNAGFRAMHNRDPKGEEFARVSDTARACVEWADRLLMAAELVRLRASADGRSCGSCDP